MELLLDLLLDHGIAANPNLGRLDAPRAEPPGEQVEEVDPVLDENATALAAIPEPVLRREVLVRGVVREGAVEHIAQHPAFHQPADGVEERVVSLHEVSDQQAAPPPGDSDQLVRLPDGQGQRLLDEDVLAGLQGGHRLRVVEERRGGDVHRVHVVAPEEPTDVVDVLDPEPGGRGPRRGPVGAGHANEPDAGYLGELLQSEQPEPPAADHAQSNEAVVHGWRSWGGGCELAFIRIREIRAPECGKSRRDKEPTVTPALTHRLEYEYGGRAALFGAAGEGSSMDDPGHEAARRDERKVRLTELALRIADGWADKLGLGKDVVEWVAVRGTERAPVTASNLIHWLDGGAGIAFVLAAPGVMELLFVVRARGQAYWVSISDNARPWDPGDGLGVRPGRLADMRRLLDAAAKFVRRAAT
jgi:hypothetical protein